MLTRLTTGIAMDIDTWAYMDASARGEEAMVG
jgi:hypothetical protein